MDFSKLNLEGDDAKAALQLLVGNKAFTGFVDSAVKNREEAITANVTAELTPKITAAESKVTEFRDNNIKLSTKLEAFDGFDAEEYKRLKKVGSTEEAAAKALKDQEDSYKALLAEKETTIAEKESAILDLGASAKSAASEFEVQSFSNNVQLAIAKHNADNPQSRIVDGAMGLFAKQVLENSTIGDNGRVMLNSEGKPLVTDKGNATVEDWIATEGKANFGYLFEKPTGGGAAGGENSGGAGGKTITRSDFEAIGDPARKSEIASTHTISD